jgi:hypothetical protein
LRQQGDRGETAGFPWVPLSSIDKNGGKNEEADQQDWPVSLK